MRHLIIRWFYIYNRVAIGLSALIIVCCVGILTYTPLARYQTSIWAWYVILALAVMQLIYSIFLLRSQKILEKNDPAVSKLTGLLNSRQQQSEILIQSITDGVVVVNNSGVITLMNPAAARMTEWKTEDSVGIDVRGVMQFLQDNGQPIEDEDPFSYVLRKAKSYDKTLLLKGRSEKQTIVSLVVSPVTNPANHTNVGAVAVFRDVSAAKAEERRRADFISTASHEMRTPVAAIEGYLALALNDKVSTIDNRARGYLEKAHTSTQHLGQLFQDLLTSAKAEDGRLTSHPTVMEMGSFLEQLTQDLRFSAEKKGLAMEYLFGQAGDSGTVSVDASAHESGSTNKVVRPLYYTYADPDRIREVITNIFDNAVKYTDTGRVSMGITGDNTVVQIYVRDTGPGIPADDIPHLFQKFYRVDNSATRTIGGTGLGLFICKKIVELYSGHIWVNSTVGKGSTFYINLPRVSTQKAEELKAHETSPNTSTPSSSTAVQPDRAS